jgi:hypothetical protein
VTGGGVRLFFQERSLRLPFQPIAHRIFVIPLLFQMTNTCVLLAHNSTYLNVN